jgi:hypothetical protein
MAADRSIKTARPALSINMGHGVITNRLTIGPCIQFFYPLTMIVMESEESFEGTEEERLHLENEFLELRLQAELGAHFSSMNGEPLPPEVEQRFLEQVIAFHQHHAQRPLVALRVHLGNPCFKPSAELNAAELDAAWQQLSGQLRAKGICVDFLSARPLEQKYDFIVRELFDYETELPAAGAQPVCFIYEDFHQDHDYDIRKRTDEFMEGFFTGCFPERSGWYLADAMATESGEPIPRELLTSLLDRFHGLFAAVKAYDYTIERITAQPDECIDGESPRLGFSEGTVRYTVLLSDGQEHQLSGPFKLCLQCVYDWWEIVFFRVHGFSWRT